MKLFIPMSGLIDKQAESERLDREIQKLRKKLEGSKDKLNNPNFVDRAPSKVVEKERTRVTEMGAALAELEKQRARIDSLS